MEIPLRGLADISLRGAKQRAFCEAVSRLGTITAAAQVIPISRDTHYEWLKDSVYEARFRDAREDFADRLRHEAMRRGVHGVKHPIMYRGEQVHQINAAGVLEPMWFIEKSDRMLIMLLKAHCEEFRDKAAIPNGGGASVKVIVERYQVTRENAHNWSVACPKNVIAREEAGS